MKKFFLFAAAALALGSCDRDEAIADSSFKMEASSADYTAQCSKPRVIISGDITTPQTWSSANVYVISGVVRVKSALTINAGTYIIADPAVAAPSANGVLVITKTGTINATGLNADGTCNPIVFTSWKLLDCDPSTVAAPGDFGGVVILGNAQVNTGVTTNIIEGLGDQANPSDFYYGSTGTESNSTSSGTFRYVRIEFAGRVLPTEANGNGVEINGLTLGGVGSGTTLDHIQVSYGLDDAFEFFGGTVNANFLIAFAQDDDGLDFDFGYTGTIIDALVLANVNSTHSQSSGSPDSNGIELDNDATEIDDNLPYTRPTVNRLSIFGAKSSTNGGLYENAIHIRRKGRLILRNSTISGYDTGIYVQPGSLPANSLFTNVEANAFILPTTTNDVSVTAFTGVTNTITSTAASFGTTQPFYNSGNSPILNFTTASRTNGAFSVNGDWTTLPCTWTKFSGFPTSAE